MTAPTVMAGTLTERYRVMTWVWRAVAIVFALVTIFPVYWMINSAFEPNSEITSLTPSFFPVHFTLHNFVSAVNQTSGLGKAYFWDDARNSVIVVTSAVVITLVLGFLAAAAISRFRLRGAAVFLVLILVVQMVPGTALIIPMFLLLNNLHLTDNYFGLILVYAATTLPFTIWALRGFVRGVPIELEEAGQVDGLSRLGAFVRILFPLMLPGLISTGIFAFITAWNDFLVADVIMQQNYAPDVAGLAVQLHHQHRHRLRRPDGRLHDNGAPGRDLLPPRPAPYRFGLYRRVSQGLNEMSTGGPTATTSTDKRPGQINGVRNGRAAEPRWPPCSRGGARSKRRSARWRRRTWPAPSWSPVAPPTMRPRAALTFSKWPQVGRSPWPPRASSPYTARRPTTRATSHRRQPVRPDARDRRGRAAGTGQRRSRHRHDQRPTQPVG